MGLDWFEYYLLTNEVRNLKKDIMVLQKEVKDLKDKEEKTGTKKCFLSNIFSQSK